VAVGVGAATVAVLRLPLSAIVLATLLTAKSGAGAGPLIILGVVVAYLTITFISRPPAADPARAGGGETEPAAPGAPAAASPT